VTSAEFTDAIRFPLTTWPGMEARAQAMNDACALETLRVDRARWNKLTRTQRTRLAELEEKASQWIGVRAQLTA
jgi:hypothetical protein